MRQPRIRMFFGWVYTKAITVYKWKCYRHIECTLPNGSCNSTLFRSGLFPCYSVICLFVCILIHIFISHCVSFGVFFHHLLSCASSFGTFHVKCTCSRTLILVTSDKINMIVTLFSKLAKRNARKKSRLCGKCVTFGIECAYLLFILWFGFLKATGNFQSQKIQSEVMRGCLGCVHFPIVNLWILLFEFEKYARKHINNEIFLCFIPSIYPGWQLIQRKLGNLQKQTKGFFRFENAISNEIVLILWKLIQNSHFDILIVHCVTS